MKWDLSFLAATVSVNNQFERIICRQGVNISQNHRANGSCKVLSLPTCWFLFYPGGICLSILTRPGTNFGAWMAASLGTAEGETVPLTLTWKLLHQMNLKGQWERGLTTASTWKWQQTFSANRCWRQSTHFSYFPTLELPSYWAPLFLIMCRCFLFITLFSAHNLLF